MVYLSRYPPREGSTASSDMRRLYGSEAMIPPGGDGGFDYEYILFHEEKRYDADQVDTAPKYDFEGFQSSNNDQPQTGGGDVASRNIQPESGNDVASNNIQPELGNDVASNNVQSASGNDVLNNVQFQPESDVASLSQRDLSHDMVAPVAEQNPIAEAQMSRDPRFETEEEHKQHSKNSKNLHFSSS